MIYRDRQIDRVLALDCSGGAVSCAVLAGDRIMAERSRALARGHGEAVMGELDAVMQEAGLRFDALDAVAVTEGPGSFTGIRVGLAAARGLGLALNIPVLGVSSFAVLADSLPRDGASLMVVIDSRRAELFVQIFGADRVALGEPFLATAAELPDHLPAGLVLVSGDAAGVVDPVPGRIRVEPSGPPDAASVARLAARLHGQGDDHRAVPLYIRAPDAIVPSQGGRIR